MLFSGNKISLVQFSHSVMSNSLWPHESQHTRPPCPSPTPRVYSDSCPSSQWCHPALSHPLSPPSPPAPNPSQHQGLFPESTLRMRWPNIEEYINSLTTFLENSINFVSNSRKVFCYHFGVACIHGLFIFIIPGHKIIRMSELLVKDVAFSKPL